MLFSGTWFTLRRGLVVLAAFGFLALSSTSPTAAPQSTAEIRAMWVLRTSLGSPDAIANMVRSARDNGFNTLLVQVRGRADAYYLGSTEPRAPELQRQPDFDPLATVIAAAHGSGLRVHAWMNVNLVSSASDLPIAQNHLIHRHPEWLMVPRDLVTELAKVPEDSPGYVGKIARWTRAQTRSTGSSFAPILEGLYASPILPEAATHVTNVVRDLVTRYKVDGVHFDYIRYPSERFDYSRGAVKAFRDTIRATLPPDRRTALDADERIDPLAYPDGLAAEWKVFRIAKLTSLVDRLRTTVKNARPDALVTVAAAPDPQEALDHRLQDWSAWLLSGLVDAVCPMAYTADTAKFTQQIAAARDVVGGQRVWAGIGAYRLPPTQTVEHIEAARRLGAAGVVLFSYDSLVDPKHPSPNSLEVIGRAAFSATATAPDASR